MADATTTSEPDNFVDAFRCIFDNQLSLSQKVFAAHRDDGLGWSMGHAMFQFLKAFLTFEPTGKSGNRYAKCYRIFNGHRYASCCKSDVRCRNSRRYVGAQRQLHRLSSVSCVGESDEPKHVVEAARGQIMMYRAILKLLQASVMEYVKAGYLMRKSFKVTAAANARSAVPTVFSTAFRAPSGR